MGNDVVQRHEVMSSNPQLSSKSCVQCHMSVTPELGGRGKNIPRACYPVKLASVISWSNNIACLKPINNNNKNKFYLIEKDIPVSNIDLYMHCQRQTPKYTLEYPHTPHIYTHTPKIQYMYRKKHFRYNSVKL